MMDNYQIRERARDVLGGKLFESPWLYPVLVMLVASAVSGAATAFTVGIGGIIITGLLSVSLCGYFLTISRYRGTHTNLSVCIDTVKLDIPGNIITGLLYTVFVMLWSLLFVIPGIIKAISYSMAFFIKAENPDISPSDAIKESMRMMNGHKWEYFCLQLSFIGWYIIGALSFGIGTLWVSAYNQTANAIFYDKVKNKIDIPVLETNA